MKAESSRPDVLIKAMVLRIQLQIGDHLGLNKRDKIVAHVSCPSHSNIMHVIRKVFGRREVAVGIHLFAGVNHRELHHAGQIILELRGLIAPKSAHFVQTLKNDRLEAIGQSPSARVQRGKYNNERNLAEGRPLIAAPTMAHRFLGILSSRGNARNFSNQIEEGCNLLLEAQNEGFMARDEAKPSGDKDRHGSNLVVGRNQFGRPSISEAIQAVLFIYKILPTTGRNAKQKKCVF